MNTIQKLEVARQQLSSAPTYDQICLYTNREALREFVEAARHTAVFRAAMACDQYNPANSIGRILSELRGHNNGDLANAESALGAIEGSDEWQVARALIHPLFTAVQELESQHAAEEHDRLLKLDAINTEREAAEAAAIEKVRAKFAVA
jgi:hypothetical protein